MTGQKPRIIRCLGHLALSVMLDHMNHDGCIALAILQGLASSKTRLDQLNVLEIKGGKHIFSGATGGVRKGQVSNSVPFTQQI